MIEMKKKQNEESKARSGKKWIKSTEVKKHKESEAHGIESLGYTMGRKIITIL